jgi:hypothetical protein
MKKMAAICVMFIKHDREFVEIIRQSPRRRNTVPKTGKILTNTITARQILKMASADLCYNRLGMII